MKKQNSLKPQIQLVKGLKGKCKLIRPQGEAIQNEVERKYIYNKKMTLCKYSSSRITEQEKENVLKDPEFQKKSKIIKIMSEVFDKKKQASIKKQSSKIKEQKQNQNENIDKPLIKKVFEDSNLTNLYFSRIKIFEYSSSTLATMGVLLSAISFELETNQSHENISKPILWVIFISCILNALTTVVRYQSILDYQKSRKEVSQRSTLLNTGQIYHLVLEFILVIIHPSPFLIGQKFTFVNSWAGPITQQQVHYFYNEILSLLGICKLFIVVRTLLLSTKWFSNSSNRVCNMYGKKPNVLFVFKALMQSNPYLCLFFVYSITLIFFGFALKISEAPLYRTGQIGFKSYANSFWTIIVTMTTIGYGDFYPYTILGRIIIFIVCLIGSLITSLMIVSLTQTLETTNYEDRAICVLDKLEAREKKRKFAAQCITQLAFLHNLNIKHRDLKENNIWFEKQLEKEKIRLLMLLRKTKKSLSDYKSIKDESFIEEMQREFEFIQKDFKIVIKEQQDLLLKKINIMKQYRMSDDIINQYDNNQVLDKALLSDLPTSDSDESDYLSNEDSSENDGEVIKKRKFKKLYKDNLQRNQNLKKMVNHAIQQIVITQMDQEQQNEENENQQEHFNYEQQIFKNKPYFREQ